LEAGLQILTDTAADTGLTPAELAELKITVIPQIIQLDGKTYRSGIDLQPAELYRRMAEEGRFPGTSTPSAGDFAQVYRQMAAADADILSIHVSGALSATLQAARMGANLTPEVNVTVVDGRSLSVVLGWQVAAAARALRAGWPLERVLELIQQVRRASESIFTVTDLRHLIHGGRISHLRGMLASALQIKPLIGLSSDDGRPFQIGMARTFSRAVSDLVKYIARKHPPGSKLRALVGHSFNPEGAALLREQVDRLFQCRWLPEVCISPVLGAHSGPTMAGVVFAPQSAFEDVP
jgi:DegV family protein with EDD domain